ncbi:hypothetical protein Adu01nite_55470 [Paractinoplanes durhamensis]|uniref:DUF1996 domain-containing protein n=1 Tax=Paractinoplanes durhamensis TaxID=113563 RepID=A0ABQ3Z2Y5_9ACTN|nr:hypothetical protein Adu01nite_55470 [Actinoplanes durhamensis]
MATGAVTVVFVSSGGRGTASAQTSLAQYVPIGRVAPNVVVPKPGRNAATGVFTVDCGTNGNGKFSPDNPVAQPGIKNGAEHVHDFVGNLAITADTPDDVLASSDTTCADGDRSSYFWPVVRIDGSVRAEAGPVTGGAAPTVSCPDVAGRLPVVPASVRAQVAAQLARLDQLTRAAQAKLGGSDRIDARRNNSVLAGLRGERAAVIKQISRTMARAGMRPSGLVSTVDCEIGYEGLHAGHTAAAAAASGATPTVSCPDVKGKVSGVPDQAAAEVDRNLTELDRQIAEANQRLVTAAGQGGSGFAENAVLGPLKAKRAATIDRIRIAIGRRGTPPAGLDALAGCALNGVAPAKTTPPAAALPAPAGPNLELPNNTGKILRPVSVLIEYRGNATGKVTPMPKFLRELTGDAKPTSRGPANARATWTCSGFADRLADKYPICPAGRRVQRVQDFPGCWDGKNIDSENHRSHVAFADPRSGACPAGFVAIPQLRITVSYAIPRDVQERGQYALDSFPEENHNPFSDHNDFVNVNSDRQMTKIAACINAGRRCG